MPLRSALKTVVIVCGLVLSGSAAVSAEATLSRIRAGGDSQQQRYVFEFDRVVPFRVLKLTGPDRLVIDFQDLDAPDQSVGDAINDQLDNISRVRFARFEPGVIRAVIEFRSAFNLVKFDRLSGAGHKGARLYIDIVLGKNLPAGQLNQLYVSEDWRRPAGTASLSASPSAEELALVNPRVRGMNRFNIVIDPGHGGIDPGTTIVPSLPEKILVLEFSRLLEEKLLKKQRFSVFLTRRDDSSLALGERYEFAEGKNAHLFVSIHADSIGDRRFRNRVSGLTLYTLSQSGGDQIADSLARAENSSDLLPGFGISDAPQPVVNLALRMLLEAKARDSRDIAHKILDGLSKKKIRISTVPHRTARFVVLKSVKIPSILIEIGYLSNPLDVSNLSNKDYLDDMSLALADAIDLYFQSMS